MTDSFRALSDTSKRLRSAHASSPGEVAGNRAVSALSSVGIGGTVALPVTHYWHMPEEFHPHQVAFVIYAWNSLVFFVGFLWRKYSGDNS